MEVSKCAVKKTVGFGDLKLSTGGDVGGQDRKNGTNERNAGRDAFMSGDAADLAEVSLLATTKG